MLVGSSKYGQANQTPDMLDLDKLEWSQASPHPSNENGDLQFSGALIYNKPYFYFIVGGTEVKSNDLSSSVKEIHRYSEFNDSWTTVGKLNTPRQIVE